MRVLVTNDDGVDTPGLAVLARAMVKAGHDVVVVAPLTETLERRRRRGRSVARDGRAGSRSRRSLHRASRESRFWQPMRSPLSSS